MKRIGFLGLLALTLATACNTTPVQNVAKPTRVLGAIELSLNSAGVSSARFTNHSTRISTLREADVVLGTGITNVITTTNDPFDYLVATFPVSHAPSSTTAFNNLTLYAQAAAGNVGDTAIKTITNFGGASPSEQVRLAKLVTPVHAVTTDVPGNIVLDTAKADFQAFTNTGLNNEVSTATNLAIAGGAMTASDTLLNYGFSARCVTICPLINSRLIVLGSTGQISIALRVPKSIDIYKFVMTFIVMDESVSRVTRSVIPSEDVVTTEARGTTVVGASELMQFGLHRDTTVLLSSVTVDDVNTSKLNASISALGIGRISAGSNGHSCGLDATGKAYCWGNNNSGQLGNNDPTHTNSITPVAVSNAISGAVNFSSITAGDIFTCGLSLNGTAYCWGSNFGGRLGNTAFDSDIPVLVANPVVGQQYANISAGYSHTCMTSVLAGIAYCWGDNSFGQLGIPNTTATSNVPVLVSGSQTYLGISAGNGYTCGIASDDLAYCWGNNSVGQLGNNDPTHTSSSTPVAVSGAATYSSVSAGNAFSCAIDLSKNAFCWGSNNNGQLGNNTIVDSDAPVAVNGGLNFSSITTGGFHTCAVAVSGDAYCWGFDGNGQLGNGLPLANVLTPSLVSAPTGGAVSYSSLSVGFSHACSISTNGNAFCWGLNTVGQLGNNSTTDSDIPIRDATTSLTL
jgi:alpha-tubulin suppressor-like RCC1 family protein